MSPGGICELVLETDMLLEEGDRVWLAVGRHCRLGIWPPGEKEYSDRGERGAEDGAMALAEDGNGA